MISLCTRSSKSTPVIAAGLFLLAVIPTVLLKLKAVMYAVKVVIPRERCKIEVFLLQTTITKCSICSMCIYFVCLVQLLLPNQIDHYYMIYRIAAILMTLRDFQGHLLIAGLFKRDFLYSCAAVDRISTDDPCDS